MPEGDTIHRTAQTLQKALAGQKVVRFETALAQLAGVDDQSPIAGRTIESVSAAGKHLLIAFSGDLTLRTHMKMNGSWHIYRPGERWMRRRQDMRIVIETDSFVAVGFNIPVAEFHTARSLARQADMRTMGPDFIGESFDDAEVLGRMRARNGAEIANVLLNQRVAAGIGNVYKSEVLFIARVNPFTLVGDLDDATLRNILAIARRVLQLNVAPGSKERRTRLSLRASDSLWVYGRGGKPCRKCDTPIEYRKQGADVRGTYWCPRCQSRNHDVP